MKNKLKSDFKKLTKKMTSDLIKRNLIPNINWEEHEAYKEWMQIHDKLIKLGEEDFVFEILGL